MAFLVTKKDEQVVTRNVILKLFAGISCYIGIVPFMLLDLFIWQFQYIYFTIFKIPLILRSDYVIIDRYNLDGLTFMQKVNCVYCGYANGVIAYSKSVTNQMEIYSCAIKHVRTPKDHAHHKDFYPRSKFE